MSPEEFVSAFHPLVVEQHKKIRKLFYELKQYTQLFLEKEDGILARTAQSLGLGLRLEFLRIDAVFAVEDVDSFPVAIEHEHDWQTSTQEMTKLAHVSMPLKVLVTYPDSSEAPGHELLKRYEEIIRNAPSRDEIAKDQKYLVIFAFDEGESIVWRYYVYPTARFDSLPIPGNPTATHA